MCNCGSSRRPQQQVQARPQQTVILNQTQGTNQILIEQVNQQNRTEVIIQNRINAEAAKRARQNQIWRR